MFNIFKKGCEKLDNNFTIEINKKSYKLKFDIYFWENLKEELNIDFSNLFEELKENFSKIGLYIIKLGIWRGFSKDQRPKSLEDLPFNDNDLELEYRHHDIIKETALFYMPKDMKDDIERLAKLQIKIQEDKIAENMNSVFSNEMDKHKETIKQKFSLDLKNSLDNSDKKK